MKGGPFGDNKKNLRKKVSQSLKKSAQKIWSRAGLEPMSFRLADLKKPQPLCQVPVEVMWHSLVLVQVNL